jgi:cystathionine beta-synthase
MRCEDCFKDPVESAMVARIETVQADKEIDDLLPIFERGHVAIVLQGDRFLGLITQIDLLNHLRRRMR